MSTPRRIVIVDDDESIRTLLVHTLPRDEFELFTFGEAPEALRLLPELRPDLILCDVMMPDMDGHTFFQEVKRLDALRQVPFLFLSAISAMVFVGPRVYAAMARDGFLPRAIAGHEGRPPSASIGMQAGVALLLVFTHTLQQVLMNVYYACCV